MSRDYPSDTVQTGLKCLARSFEGLLRSSENLDFSSVHSTVHQVFLEMRDTLDFANGERGDFDRFRDEFFLQWKALRKDS